SGGPSPFSDPPLSSAPPPVGRSGPRGPPPALPPAFGTSDGGSDEPSFACGTSFDPSPPESAVRLWSDSPIISASGKRTGAAATSGALTLVAVIKPPKLAVKFSDPDVMVPSGVTRFSV